LYFTVPTAPTTGFPPRFYSWCTLYKAISSHQIGSQHVQLLPAYDANQLEDLVSMTSELLTLCQVTMAKLRNNLYFDSFFLFTLFMYVLTC